jgi:hypothetical protein
VNKDHSKSGHSTVGKDVSTSDNLPPSSENSICQLSQPFSFIKTLSCYHSFESERTNKCHLELQSHDSVANITEYLLKPQVPSHLTCQNLNQFPNNQSVKNVVHELSELTSNQLRSEPLFYFPQLCFLVSGRPLLALSIDDEIDVEECPEVDSNHQKMETEEYEYVIQTSHWSPLLVNEQDIDNLANHQNALWSWSKNVQKQSRKEIASNCSREDALNDSVLTLEQVNIVSSNEILKQAPLNEEANAENSNSDERALYQIMKLLNIPKRTVTTQVDFVENVLQGSEVVTVENETDNRHNDLLSVLQRVMLHLPKYENSI